MKSTALRLLKKVTLLFAIGVFSLLAIRAYDSQRGLPLEPWHTYVPHELTAKKIARSDWTGYLAAEEAVFEEVRTHVTRRLDPKEWVPSNRYYAKSPVYPGNLPRDWNRSYIMEPEGEPVGAVVLLHGLTDSPYSQRHIARRYRDDGFVAIVIRLPAHGTVPAALTKVDWEDWSEATRLAVREARRRVGPSRPLHLVGFSNGGALAMKYVLDAIEDPGLSRPERVVLISPMIGITSMARFAGVFGWPAIFPPFAKASWLTVMPEFNPFKYNSFPINGARQSSLLTRGLQQQIARLAREGRLSDLPPILTFQSVVDFTVSTRAIVSSLYERLPANGSELVLFDLNRNTKFGPLLRPDTETETVFSRLIPEPPRRFRTTIITNASQASREVVERIMEPGTKNEKRRALGLSYPADVFSLSHVALPFPMSDPLYGLQPDPAEDYGVNLGAMALRGERGILIVSLDSLIRMSANPFFPFLLERIDEGTGRRNTGSLPATSIPESRKNF